MNDNLIRKHKYYNNAFFARWAKLYDYEKYILFFLRKKASKFLNTAPPQKILDVASGTGAQAFEFAKLGYEVIGIDLSPEMLQQARKKIRHGLKLLFQQADATELPFRDNAFDISSISLGLHDMPYEIGIKVLNEMKRVTKENGQLLIIDYMEPKKHVLAKMAFPIIYAYETKNWKPFIDRGLKNLLNEVGLTIDQETNATGLFQIASVVNKKRVVPIL